MLESFRQGGFIFLLGLLLGQCLGCNQPRNPRASDDDDSGGLDDDDSAGPDDDDTASDDDDTASDDDDMGDPQGPTIDSIEVCQTMVIGSPYARFDVTVTDPDGDLLAPLTYRFQVDEGALETLQSSQELGHAGVLGHLEPLEAGDLLRGTAHDFTFQVLDAAAHASPPESTNWTIPEQTHVDSCD